MIKEMEKAEVLNATFTLVFTGKTCLQKSQTPKSNWTQQVHATWWGVSLRTKGAGRCHYEATLNYLWKGMLTGRGSWGLGERKCHSCVQERWEGGSGEILPGHLHLSPWKVLQQILLGTIAKHVKSKKVIRSSHRWFMKGKSCLTNLLIAFSSEMSGLVDEGRELFFLT